MVAHLRLGSAGQQHWPSVYLSLCSGCHKLAAAFSSEALKLQFCPSQPLCLWGGFPGYRNLSSFTAPFQGVQDPSWFLSDFLFLFLFFSNPVTWRFSCSFSSLRFFCQHWVGIHSVKIIPRVDVFLMYLWKKLGFISYYSAILGALQMCLTLKSIDWIT